MTVCAAIVRFGGTRLHLKRALLAGGTPRQVLEALQIAATPGGLPVLWSGAAILEKELRKMKIKFKEGKSLSKACTRVGLDAVYMS